MSARVTELVTTLLGPHVMRWIDEDTDVFEILIRPGWVATDREQTGLQPEPQTRESINLTEVFRVLAPLYGTEATAQTPLVEGDIPGLDVRFAGVWIGQNGEDSVASLRKPTKKIYTFDNLEEQGVINGSQRGIFEQWISQPNSGLLLCGKPGSGKTSMIKSTIYELIQARGVHEHIVVVEDTREIRVDGPFVTYLTATPWLTYQQALRAALRQRPSRLVVGEVRGGESLDAIKAGGIGAGLLMSIHAETTEGAVRMLRARAREGTVSGAIDDQLVSDGIQVVAALSRVGNRFRVDAIGRLLGLTGDKVQMERIA